jgi:hypothetical protein
MTKHGQRVVRAAALAAVIGGAPGAAYAVEATPSIVGNGWVAIGIIVALVALIWLLISGSLGIAARDKSDDDEAGVGMLEGIDEDDEPKRRKRK